MPTSSSNSSLDTTTTDAQNLVSSEMTKMQGVVSSALGSSPYQLTSNGEGGYTANESPSVSSYSTPSSSTTNFDASQLASNVVITEGLDATPWFSDSGLLTGDVRLRKQVQPVTFQVMLHDTTDFYLSSGNVPVQIQLNASIESINWSMKHLYHHQRTRTAHHITMWGMQADIIEGKCTTGVFMNQFGLTDYYSTRTISDKLKTLVTSGQMFTSVQSTGNTGNTSDSILSSNGDTGGNVTVKQSSTDYQEAIKPAKSNNSNYTDTDAFRVAAQDAFMEFLALFKMNGSVWFWNKSYQDDTGESRDWVGIQAWSPTLGMSSSQENGRNNDILTRGGVVMTYRNFAYQGYFKSLQWTIDARNPYKWDFSFVFQVEKTVGQQFIPGS